MNAVAQHILIPDSVRRIRITRFKEEPMCIYGMLNYESLLEEEGRPLDSDIALFIREDAYAKRLLAEAVNKPKEVCRSYNVERVDARIVFEMELQSGVRTYVVVGRYWTPFVWYDGHIIVMRRRLLRKLMKFAHYRRVPVYLRRCSTCALTDHYTDP